MKNPVIPQILTQGVPLKQAVQMAEQEDETIRQHFFTQSNL